MACDRQKALAIDMTSSRYSFLGRSLFAALLLGALGVAALAQATAPAPSATPALPVAAPTGVTPPAAPKKSAGIPAPKPTLSEDEFHAAFIAALNKEPAAKSDYEALFAAIFGVLVSAGISFAVAKLTIRATKADTEYKAKQEKEKAKIDTALAYTTKMLDLKIRQLEKFYAPLLACTQQIKGIHDKLTHYLHQQGLAAGTYRWFDDPKHGKRLQVKAGADWADFRLLDQLPALKSNDRVMALIDQILEIDGEMVKIIREHNGLAAVETTISPCYGEFLAHYAIISLERKGPAAAAHAPGSHEIGYYPRDLDALILKEYDATRCAVREYQEMSNTALQWLKEVKN